MVGPAARIYNGARSFYMFIITFPHKYCYNIHKICSPYVSPAFEINLFTSNSKHFVIYYCVPIPIMLLNHGLTSKQKKTSLKSLGKNVEKRSKSWTLKHKKTPWWLRKIKALPSELKSSRRHQRQVVWAPLIGPCTVHAAPQHWSRCLPKGRSLSREYTHTKAAGLPQRCDWTRWI